MFYTIIGLFLMTSCGNLPNKLCYTMHIGFIDLLIRVRCENLTLRFMNTVYFLENIFTKNCLEENWSKFF
jgi:hypothetical protein